MARASLSMSKWWGDMSKQTQLNTPIAVVVPTQSIYEEGQYGAQNREPFYAYFRVGQTDL